MSTCQLDHVMDSPWATPTAVSQGRKRPLRTYSRRTIQTRAQEQEATQSDRDPTTMMANSIPAEVPDQHPVLQSQSEAERPAEAKRPNRGSILAYFRPVLPSTDKALSKVAAFGTIEPPLTPRISPELRGANPRRRLTTRPQFGEVGEVSRDDVGRPINVGNVNAVEGAETDGERDESADNPDCSLGSPHDPPTEALGELPTNTLGRHDWTVGVSTDGRVKPKKRAYKQPVKDMMQTTLSLSVQKEPGFILCGVCDILYNPFNEKDRKEHNRRHAASSRKRRKTA
ncbi:hypothetical protein MYCTH_2308818 [Thermothelomyces thermophilus ATCC 42464]|uniref:N-acetyltransferase ESCO zinc-finger domain-containing protein n=1 Tax=Thermothelomyces thermophilus (strain ATCC 42464 / BCRC 31852 / DSM 1799) TaxID=573729 RepID=G2QKB6_THET4|nr:uncharacterized protein MYCTH_2308818 [Thermothelomyces thermophilus ATCC 42464]AEO60022.1 hypothetical protein MYCTH_2308818 [Thermothelomyces thermophilus ATCC 42464]